MEAVETSLRAVDDEGLRFAADAAADAAADDDDGVRVCARASMISETLLFVLLRMLWILVR